MASYLNGLPEAARELNKLFGPPVRVAEDYPDDGYPEPMPLDPQERHAMYAQHVQESLTTLQATFQAIAAEEMKTAKGRTAGTYGEGHHKGGAQAFKKAAEMVAELLGKL